MVLIYKGRFQVVYPGRTFPFATPLRGSDVAGKRRRIQVHFSTAALLRDWFQI